MYTPALPLRLGPLLPPRSQPMTTQKPNSASNSGKKHRRRRKMSEANKAKIRNALRSPAVRVRRSLAHRGTKRSAATRAKMSAALRAKWRSPSFRARVRAGKMGHIVTAATRIKISAALRGRPVPLERRARISRALKGRHLSAATRAKISARLKGRSVSETTRARLSAAHRGRSLPPETRAKISRALKGRTLSAATRAKVSASKRAARNGQFLHGFYAKPVIPFQTDADRIRALTDVRARLSELIDQDDGRDGVDQVHLHDLYCRTLKRLARLLRPQWEKEADEKAAQARLGDLEEILREMEEDEERKKSELGSG